MSNNPTSYVDKARVVERVKMPIERYLKPTSSRLVEKALSLTDDKDKRMKNLLFYAAHEINAAIAAYNWVVRDIEEGKWL